MIQTFFPDHNYRLRPRPYSRLQARPGIVLALGITDCLCPCAVQNMEFRYCAGLGDHGPTCPCALALVSLAHAHWGGGSRMRANGDHGPHLPLRNSAGLPCSPCPHTHWGGGGVQRGF
eukprot:scaffold57613_cov17-Tisochrysis_lutea.AAC.1